MKRAIDLVDVDAQSAPPSTQKPAYTSSTAALKSHEEPQSCFSERRTESQVSQEGKSKVLWPGLSFLASIFLHGALLLGIFLFAPKETLQAPAGGVPLEVELVVGFVDSVPMEAGSKEAVTEADKIGENAPPPTKNEVETKTETKLQKAAEAPEPQQESATPTTSAIAPEVPAETESVEAPVQAQVRDKPLQTVDAELVTPVAKPSIEESSAAKAQPAVKPNTPPKPKTAQNRSKPIKPRIAKRVTSQRTSRKPIAQESFRRGDGAQTSRASNRGGSGGASQYSGQASAATHRAKILAHLARYKQYPSSARAQGIQGRPMVAFRVGPDGSVSGVSLSRTSGASILDHAVIDMVRRAAPFPKGPSVQSFNLGVTYDLR